VGKHCCLDWSLKKSNQHILKYTMILKNELIKQTVWPNSKIVKTRMIILSLKRMNSLLLLRRRGVRDGTRGRVGVRALAERSGTLELPA
jgi:hypothetical protein